MNNTQSMFRDPYCIYCDEGEDGDHSRCAEIWEAAQRSSDDRGLLPIAPAPERNGMRRNASFSWGQNIGSSDLPS